MMHSIYIDIKCLNGLTEVRILEIFYVIVFNSDAGVEINDGIFL